MLKIKNLILKTLSVIPYLKMFPLTRRGQTPVKMRMFVLQKIFGFNKKAYWPVHHSSLISNPEKILIGVETCPGYMPGCYVQGGGGIVIGDYTQISCNVGLISKNHDVYQLDKHINVEFPSIVIGEYCWISMNAIILPGVKLGDCVVVGAGSVVTKSFPEGFCVIAGNPARLIRKLDPNMLVRFKSNVEYIGYIQRESFNLFRERNLKI